MIVQTITTGIFIQDSYLLEFGMTRSNQVMIQILGVTAAFVWSFGVSFILMTIINKFFPMRVSPSHNVSNTIRKTDYFGRHGGEEFLVIMPKTDLETAYIFANMIREKIEKMIWDFSKGYTITVSGGVVENAGEDLNKMISRADSLLYCAKEKGRNKIVK